MRFALLGSAAGKLPRGNSCCAGTVHAAQPKLVADIVFFTGPQSELPYR